MIYQIKCNKNYSIFTKIVLLIAFVKLKHSSLFKVDQSKLLQDK